MAFKLDPQAIPDLPQPRPKYEIFVYSPRFEGVHLRFGAVARGGLRWSDRREDFRTEVLGLVKAQMVKNAVIVPVGAKGGFVLKQKPGDRDEAVACYRRFITALLDVTDNIHSGKIVPPRDVVRHDGDDPYLVVAADKGTATFSDIANEISVDARTSGSATRSPPAARPATTTRRWASPPGAPGSRSRSTSATWAWTPRPQDFTVVGVGDMSGDVFGNGMLLSASTSGWWPRSTTGTSSSTRTRTPATSYAERRRLFDLPRSSWADYDAALISEGGGVFPRTAKSIPVTPQVRAALGLGDATAVSPAELMRAILAAPGRPAVQRRHRHLREGGHARPTPRSATRPTTRSGSTARELRVKVVGEGGNLGLTQRGRIEFARAGGRIYTDFIDNTAGVDCSDHEVNIKILLGGAVTDGELTVPAPRRTAGHDDRRGRRAGAAGQLRAGDRARQRPVAGALAAAGAPPDADHAGEVRPAQPRAGGAADGQGTGRPRRGRATA